MLPPPLELYPLEKLPLVVTVEWVVEAE